MKINLLKQTYRYILTAFPLLLSLFLQAQGIITTVAGGPIGDGKLATSVGLVEIQEMVTDKVGNIYILDRINNRVRKISAATGIINTIAGGGKAGDGDPALNASLLDPQSIAIDGSGNIYVLERFRLAKIDAVTGIINTIAGKGSTSGDGGPAINARFQSAMRMVSDFSGNLYIIDGHRIRKIDAATGIISTIAGNGIPGSAGDGGLAINAQLSSPSHLAIDIAGNIYIATNNTLRKISASSGVITTIAGTGLAGLSGNGGPAISAQITNPFAIVCDLTGNIYLTHNNRVRKITISTGLISNFAGTGTVGYTGDGGPAINAAFYNPQAMAISNTGNVLIADFSNYVLRKVEATTGIISTIYGNGTVGTSDIGGLAINAQLYGPRNIAVDAAGNIYSADSHNYKIYKITASTGLITTIAGTGEQGLNDGNGGLAINAKIMPSGLSLDASGNLYFLDGNGISVRKITMATGIVTRVAGNGIQYGYAGDGGLAINAAINRSLGFTVDALGNIFIADKDNHCIRKVSATTGIITTVAGTGTIMGYTGDGGLATAAKLKSPFDIAVDNVGNLYISDNGNHVIRKVAAGTGIISTIAGTGTNGYSGDGGPANAAQLNYPYGLSTDAMGNVYVADQFNSRVRKITPAGPITTVAGNGTTFYNGDDISAGVASIHNPTDIAFDVSGNMYIADAGNNRIRKVTVIYSLPVNNFKVSSTGESCKASNNGSINITAAQALTYTSTITGKTTPYAFTNSLEIKDLSAGTYGVCITIADQPDYKQCFEVIITEPKDFEVYSTLDKSINTISLKLEGGTSFNVELNGKVYKTSQNQITLSLIPGENKLKVSTDKPCQGIIEKTITLSEEIAVYPNPFENILTLNLVNNSARKAGIEIRGLDGKLVYSKQHVNEDGSISLDLSNLSSSMYLLKLSSGDSEKIFKILKK